MNIPTINTERLILRPAVFEDFEAYKALMASPRAKGMGGPHDEAAAWGWFCQDVAQWQLFGHGALMIDLLENDECVGEVGINHGPLFPEKELGWMIYDGHEGQGYATEAATALRDWAFSNIGVKTLVSYIDNENGASQAVAKKLGGELDQDAQRPDAHDLVYRYYR